MSNADKNKELEREVLSRYHNPTEWKEGERLEFKRATSKLPDDMWETYCAFANAHGGIIVLGVEDNGSVTGVQNAPMLHKRLTTLLNNGEKISVNLCLETNSYCCMSLDGKEVIALHVPAASVKQKPVYYNGNMMNTFYRSHESDVRCKEEMIQQMIRDKRGECKSARLISGTTWECVDIASWRGYRNRMMSYDPEHAWVALDDTVLLEKLGGYARSQDSSEEGLTLAGLLMFGTDDAIRKFFPRYHVDFFEYDGSEEKDISKRWTERIYNDGNRNCNLYQFFYQILPRLTESLKRPFRLNPDLTAQGDTASHKAVREALANAIIHADYDGDGGVVIQKYPDKIIFENPGTLLISRDQMMRGGVSECRNIGLQTMFLRMGIAEKAGAGIDTIFRGWTEQLFKSPEIYEYANPFRIKWILPLVSIISMGDEAKLKEHIGREAYESLGKNQRMLLIIVLHEKEAGIKEIHKLCPNVHPRDLAKQLAELVRMGCLDSEGRTSAKTYRLPNKVRPEGISLPEQDYPPSVLAVRNSMRATRSEMKQAILDICRDRWATNAELCNLLNRKSQALYIALSILEDTGKLVLRYPEKPNHPQQAYHTSETFEKGTKNAAQAPD